MRLSFTIVLVSINLSLLAQLPLFLLSNEQEGALPFNLDKSPKYRIAQDLKDDNIWSMSQLMSPFYYQFDINEPIASDYLPADTESPNLILNSPFGDQLYIDRKSTSSTLIAEAISIDGIDNPLWKIYNNGYRNLNLYKDHNRHLSNRIVSEIKVPVGTFDNDYNYKVELEEDVSINNHTHGTLYLPSAIHDAIKLTIHIDRDYTTYVQNQGKWLVTDKVWQSDKLQQLLMDEWFEVYLDHDSKRVLALVKKTTGDKADYIFFKTEVTGQEAYNPALSESFILYPNISYGDIRMDFSRFRPSVYTLEIYSILGKRVWSKQFFVDGTDTFQEDLSFLPKGNYQYSLIDSDGLRLLSRRLGIIKY